MDNSLTQLSSRIDDLSNILKNLTGALGAKNGEVPLGVNWQENIIAIWKEQNFILPKYAENKDLDQLYKIENQKRDLDRNIQNFLNNKAFNSVLITGSRGMGKSSLVAGILQKYSKDNLRLIQVAREEFHSLHKLFSEIANYSNYKFIVFFDDLSFEKNDADYKNLKSTLENGLNLVPQNVCIIATSNRKHLLPEKMQDNLEGVLADGDLRPSETLEETLSLADRFGLWLSFYPFNQEDYLEVVRQWLERIKNTKIEKLNEETKLQALQFATRRGARNGRIAKHFAIYWLSNLENKA